VDAQRRLCSLRADTLHDASQWLELHRRFWHESLDKLAALLEAPPPPHPKAPRTRRNTRRRR
jgi:hypothetical protein